MKSSKEQMRKLAFLILLSLSCINLAAQEFNCTVAVNAQKVSQTNQQIFQTLERSLTEFINKKKWTNKNFAYHERINCSMIFNIETFDDSDSFTATLQVQSSRPVFGSSYQTPLLNFNDEQVAFDYIEYQPLAFNENEFQSNLVSIVAFYMYTMLGIDADTFSLKKGAEYFQTAQKVINQAQVSDFQGWKQSDGNRSRFQLMDNMMSNTFAEYRTVMYKYHRWGLDIMSENKKKAKEDIIDHLAALQKLDQRRPNSFLMQIFFDAKAEEIESMYTDGPSVDIVDLKNVLNRVAPFHASKWSTIKY